MTMRIVDSQEPLSPESIYIFGMCHLNAGSDHIIAYVGEQ